MTQDVTIKSLNIVCIQQKATAQKSIQSNNQRNINNKPQHQNSTRK